MKNIIKKNKFLLFKHEKSNQTLSNDWPIYCHTGIYLGKKGEKKATIYGNLGPGLGRAQKCGGFKAVKGI
jgi:hypothetical protein